MERPDLAWRHLDRQDLAEQLTLTAAAGAMQEEDRAARAGGRRVVLLDLLLAASAIPLLHWLAGYDRPVSVAVAVSVAVLFVVAEWLPIDVEIGDQSHTFSFTAVPLVVGLSVLPPELVIGLRAAASLLVLGLVHRQGPIKLATNVVSHVLQACTAAALIVPLVGGAPNDPRDWLVVVVAVALAELVGTAVVTAAIALFEGSFDRELLAGALTGWIALAPDVLLALVAAILLDLSPSALWLVAGIGVMFGAAIRLTAQVTARYRVLEVLDGFTSRLGEAVAAGRMRDVLLEQFADLLHAEEAWIERPDDDGTRLVWKAGRTSVEPLGDRGALLRQLADPGASEAIVGSISVDRDSILAGVVHRRGDIREFDGEDRRLFNLLIGHVGIGLQNVRLVEALREEAHANELLATRDQLTGLANRTLFTRWMEDVLALGDGAAVLVVGLDRFREVNETLGHAAGDELLRQVAGRIEGCAGLVARLGGDEFGVLWAGTDRDEVTDHARAVLGAVDDLYRLDGIDLDLDVSARGGLAFALQSTLEVDATTLLRHADVAKELAREDRSGLRTYSADVDTFSLAQLALVGSLRAAIDAEELELHFQPQLDLRTERVVGAEALLRWTPPGRAPVPPTQFIEIAERTGLITPLTRFVLRQTVRQAKQWFDAGRRWRISANLSTRNLTEPDLVAFVAALLAEHQLPAELLELEVTETAVMRDPEQASRVMAELRALGVSISVDDFGTGHSSLAQLIRLPVDQLKIDRQFVLDMETDAAALAVVQTIVDLGQRLGLEIVAEGVETATNLQALRAMSCTTVQGYYYARPMPAAGVDAWVASREAEAAYRALTVGAIPSTRIGAPVSPLA